MAQENKSAGAEWVLQSSADRVNDTQNPHTRTVLRLVSECVGSAVVGGPCERHPEPTHSHAIRLVSEWVLC